MVGSKNSKSKKLPITNLKGSSVERVQTKILTEILLLKRFRSNILKDSAMKSNFNQFFEKIWITNNLEEF